MDVDPPQTSQGVPAVRSIEGWIIVATNIHEEADLETIQDVFGEYGEVRNVHMNLDRLSGYVKGYVLIEYAELEEAKAAVEGVNGTKILDQTVVVDFAFVKDQGISVMGAAKRGGPRRNGGRSRSRSPGRD